MASPSKEGSNPLRAVMNIRREELPLALLMFFYFFLVITTFWILKPIKKTVFIGFYENRTFDWLGPVLDGPQAELIAKVMNMFVAYVAVVVFSALARHLRRQQLTFVFSGLFLVAYVGYSRLLNGAGEATVWSFYLFGDAFSTLMVATFFAFLNDSVTPDKAKRIYGLIGLGGVTGGAFGSMFVRTLISELDTATWMWVCFGVTLVIVGVAFLAGRLVDRDPPPEAPAKPDEKPTTHGNPAFEGARLVFRSRYLLSVVAIVGLYEIVSTIMDFQFTATIVHYLEGPAIGKQFATMYAFTNVVALLVQLLFTSFVMTRFGVGVALMVLPIAALGGSGAFMALPILWVGSLLNTADNAFSYSINQSAKEALYVPTTRDEKYKAKAFIDMFVQRFAKAIAVGVSLGITSVFTDFSSVRWLSAFTVAMILLWLMAARYAGHHFKQVTESDG
ncbi:MAG: MFS transporter [Myxococcales bacterium]|nr:MFS transporter [Myxococcales bacterium]